MRLRRYSGFVGTCLILGAIASCGRKEPPAVEPPPVPAPTASDTFFLPPADTTAAREAFDYENRVGVARGSGESMICLEIANSRLLPGDLVTLVSPLNRAFSGAARVVASAGDSCAGAAFDPSADHYTLKLIQGGLDEGEFAIAIVGDVPTPRLRAGVMSADLDGDGAIESFHSCSSHEGIHLTIWTGSPPEGERRWHRYVHLGMDLEPNCTAAETRPARAGSP